MKAKNKIPHHHIHRDTIAIQVSPKHSITLNTIQASACIACQSHLAEFAVTKQTLKVPNVVGVITKGKTKYLNIGYVENDALRFLELTASECSAIYLCRRALGELVENYLASAEISEGGRDI